MKKLSILIAALFLILAANPFFAQEKGSIKGKVFTAEDSLAFIGVQVFIRQNNQKLIGTVSDKNGNFTLKPLAPGKYTVHFRFTGYQEYSVVDIGVTDNQITFLNEIYLKQGIDLTETEVFGEKHKGLIEIDGGNLTKFEGKDYTNMPNPTDIESSLQYMSSQFQVNENTREINFRGSRDGETAYFIDGVRVDSPQGIPKAAIASIKIYMGGVPARYGDFTGGVVVIETKSHFDWLEEQKALERMLARTIAQNDSLGG
jgi:hypothetical protein